MDEDHDREIHEQRQPQGIADDLHDRRSYSNDQPQSPCSRPENPFGPGMSPPDQVLLPDRPVEPVLLDEELRLCDSGGFALRAQLRDLVGQEVARAAA